MPHIDMIAQAPDGAAITSDLPELRIAEVVLQTARWPEMNRWYDTFIGREPCAETDRMCWRRVSDAQSQLFVLFRFTALDDRPATVTGLNHIQLKCASLRNGVAPAELVRNEAVHRHAEHLLAGEA